MENSYYGHRFVSATGVICKSKCGNAVLVTGNQIHRPAPLVQRQMVAVHNGGCHQRSLRELEVYKDWRIVSSKSISYLQENNNGQLLDQQDEWLEGNGLLRRCGHHSGLTMVASRVILASII